MSNNCKVPEVKPIVIKRFINGALTPTVPTNPDCNTWQNTDLKDGEFAVNTVTNKLYLRSGKNIIELTSGGSGSVTSVGLTMPSAFSVANSPITGAGTLVVTATGTTGEYIRGDGSLATFPTIPSFTPSALTKTDDTNVTLTLGGTPNTALLEATSLTLGWSGELAVSRGGTGAGTFTANNVLLGNGTSSFQTVAPGSSGNVLTSDGTTWVSQAPTGGGITIGTTAIASGTAGRILFEGAGNVVQQSSNFFWDNTNSRLGIRVATPTASLEVLGAAPSGTSQSFAVHNSTGNNNALIVRDDGFVGIGALPFSSVTPIRIKPVGSGGNQNFFIRAFAGNTSTIEIGNLENGGSLLRSIRIYGSPIRLSVNNTEDQITLSGELLTSTNLNIKGQASSDGNLNTLTLQNSTNTLTGQISLQWTRGTGNVDVGRLGIWSSNINNIPSEMRFSLENTSDTVVEVMRLVGNGNLLLGTVTDVASSILTLESTTKGFLPPRMTTANRNAIATPATGLTVYNTTTNTIDVRDNVEWKSLSTIDELQIALTAQVYN